VIAIASVTALLAAAVAQATRYVPRCAVFKVGNVSYGVYVVRGHVSCQTAESILMPADRLKGRLIDNYNSLYSYTLMHGWLCPVASRGFQACEHNRRPTVRPKWLIISRPCLTSGSACPAFGKASKPL
jgi:hypothetical protein